jgi:hypothetical protein
MEYIFGFTIIMEICFLNRMHEIATLHYVRYEFLKQWLQIFVFPLF